MLTEQFSRMQQGSKGEEVCSKFTAEVIGDHPRELSQPEQFANIKTIVHLVSPRSVLKKTEKVLLIVAEIYYSTQLLINIYVFRTFHG